MRNIASVKCEFCGITLDKNKVPHGKIKHGSRFRYGHVECCNTKLLENPKLNIEFINPKDYCQCCFCKETINKKQDDIVTITNEKFAHKLCYEQDLKRELTEEEKLDRYIMKLFNLSYVTPKFRKQINTFVKDYNYSYSGIRKALIYYYEILKKDFDPKFETLGIVPYIYKKAYTYYYDLWLAKQKNAEKDIESYKPKDITIKIKNPKKVTKVRNLFSFLDEEE